MDTKPLIEDPEVPLKRGFPDARVAQKASQTFQMAPQRRRFRLALRLGLALVCLLAAGLLFLAGGADAKGKAVRGFVFEAEKAVFLESDDGDIYVLKGKGLDKYYDKYVEVSGETKTNAQGENELTVSSVKIMTAPGAGVSEDQPGKPPAKGAKQ